MRGQVPGAGVAEGHRRVLGTPGQQQAERAAHRRTPADHHHLGPLQRYAVPAQQHDDAARGARQRAGVAEHQPAQVHRVQPVRVLARVDQLQHPLGVQVVRQRKLDEVTVAGRVGVQLGDGRLHVGLAGVRRQVTPDGGDAHLGTVPVLAVDVRLRAGIVPDQDRAEAGPHAPLGQLLHPCPEVFLHRGGDGLAVQKCRAHFAHPAMCRRPACRKAGQRRRRTAGGIDLTRAGGLP